MSTPAEVDVIDIECVIARLTQPTEQRTKLSLEGVIFSFIAIFLVVFAIAAVLKDKLWAIWSYAGLVCAGAIYILIFFGQILLAVSKNGRSIAASKSRLFIVEQALILDLSRQTASHLEFMRNRIELEIKLMEDRIKDFPLVVGLGSVAAPIFVFVSVQTNDALSGQAAAFGAVFSFAAILGSLAHGAAKRTWQHALFVLEQSISRAQDILPPAPQKKRRTHSAKTRPV